MPENTNEETRQPTIESLTAQNTQLQGDVDAAKGQLATTKSQLAKAEEKLAGYKNQLDAVKGELATANGERAAAQAIITGQAEQLANVEAAQTQADVIVVTYEKQQYRVLGKKFRIKNVEVKAEELGKNKEALKFLVESKSGLLVPIEKK
ncbi:hypothetical protein CDA63_11795 [Hymenobacter amundsenii]|uniref:Uncharacterized protein n=1 Tax=Hymenobacter amundsenii TaxID=2006685 RepID=A0A246FJY7_9BACT|nr:hypothetical protein [Hymenobacter amundsenii]OWP62894.1 hypothetical protein CDA63_11795 [Hymenobacter amundsenii]